MRGRVGRQSRRRTKRELAHSLSRRARKWVKEVWEAAQDVIEELPLTPLTEALSRRLAETDAAADGLEAQEIQEAWFAVMKAGYASRAVLAEPTEQPVLKRSALRLRGTAPDPQETAAVDGLLDRVRNIAVTDFSSVMNLPEQVWSGYVATAGTKLQRELTTGPVTWRELDRDRIDRMMRYGYVLRCVDEALDATPALRQN
jgi:hypothetical protein